MNTYLNRKKEKGVTHPRCDQSANLGAAVILVRRCLNEHVHGRGQVQGKADAVVNQFLICPLYRNNFQASLIIFKNETYKHGFSDDC